MKIHHILGLLLFLWVAPQAMAQKKITLEDYWLRWSFYPQTVSGLNSMSDGEHYTVLADRNKIVKYAYQTGEVIDTLLNVETLENSSISSISGYEMSSDESKILFYTKREAIYRRSFTAEYYVWDMKTQQISPVSENGRQQLTTLSPTGDKVAFVRNNNIFVKNLPNGTENKVTTDGEKNKIINGAPDWVYEEEFGFNKAYEWSPDGKYIAYMRFDESEVKNFAMTMFKGQKPELTENALYPETRVWKYPKAGEDNSIVSVHVYNVETKNTRKIDVGKETDQYIPRIRWTQTSEKLGVFRVNRLQNHFELLLASPQTGKSEVVYNEKNKYYIAEAHYDRLVFLDDNEHFVLSSEKDGYSHIYLYKLNGELVKQITEGKWDVTEFLGYDKDKKRFFYESAEESPLRRNVYSITLKGKKKKLSEQKGTNHAQFSDGYKYYINYFSSAKRPTYVTLHNAKGKLIRVLEDNAKLLALLEKYEYNDKEFFTFETSQGVALNGYMIKPPNFDPAKKYPVFMTQYSGPNSQSVLDSWSFNWEYYLAQEGFLVACVDPRGTGARGEEFRKMTYLQLGKYETIDQIEAAKYLGSLPYTDASRIGIYGWSYGGFMAALCMTKGADQFKTGISVAPVSNWRYYDNIYTERFMRTPQENPDGYDDNSPINYVKKLKGSYLLVHGSADDNVHLQNSMELAEALVQANKDFDMHIYTNRNHSIYGGYTRLHLFRKMVTFLKENL